MKEFLFNIGYMSKITNVNIKSLRYYEEIGVLTPEFVDPETKYRYYSYQQIPIVMALRFCLTLEIPLIKFKNYKEQDGGCLNYDTLIQDGQTLVNEKLNKINKMIHHLDLSMQEMQRSESQKRGEIFRREIGEVCVLLKNIEHRDNKNYFNNIGMLLDEAKSKGFESGFEFGHCSVFCDNRTKDYTYIDLSQNNNSNEVMAFPSGLYSCIQDKNISVDDAPDIFPEIYNSNKKVFAIASEVFARKYDLNSPLIELRVIGVKDEGTNMF